MWVCACACVRELALECACASNDVRAGASGLRAGARGCVHVIVRVRVRTCIGPAKAAQSLCLLCCVWSRLLSPTVGTAVLRPTLVLVRCCCWLLLLRVCAWRARRDVAWHADVRGVRSVACACACNGACARACVAERVRRDGGLQTIVFCSSVESTHRLARLLQLYGGFPGDGVYEFSRTVSQVRFLAAAAAGAVVGGGSGWWWWVVVVVVVVGGW